MQSSLWNLLFYARLLNLSNKWWWPLAWQNWTIHCLVLWKESGLSFTIVWWVTMEVHQGGQQPWLIQIHRPLETKRLELGCVARPWTSEKSQYLYFIVHHPPPLRIQAKRQKIKINIAMCVVYPVFDIWCWSIVSVYDLI